MSHISAMKQHFVYRWICVATGQYYIGSTSHMPRRLNTHHWKVKTRKHTQPILDLIDAHGIESFKFEVLETVLSKEEAVGREKVLIAEAGSLSLNIRFGTIRSRAVGQKKS